MRNSYSYQVFVACVGLCVFLGVANMVGGCASATNTAYQGEAAALVAEQAAVTAWNTYHASHTVDASTEAKVQSLFASAKSAYELSVHATEAAVGFETNSAALNSADANAAFTQTVNDLTAFLKTIGVKI